MAKKIDPLNKKQYSAVSAMLTVSDIPAAVNFYQRAFGFSKRAIMKGPDGKPMHAEVALRGTTLLLGPENPAWGTRSAKSVGASPAGLFIYAAPKVVHGAYEIRPCSKRSHVHSINTANEHGRSHRNMNLISSYADFWASTLVNAITLPRSSIGTQRCLGL